MAVCLIHEKKPMISKCPRSAWEGDPDSLCLLHSYQRDKDQDGQFTDAVKQQVYAEHYNCNGVFFPGIIDFSGDGFTKRVDFSWATFKNANFTGTIFFDEADFSWTTFQKADFSKATFQKANFSPAIFHEANFFWAKINGPVTLAGIRSGEPPKVKMPWRGRFGFIQFAEKGVLRLEELSLARVEFTGTDLRRVEFDRVTWASWWWRTAVYDEILLHQRRWAHIFYLLNYGWLWGKRIPGEKEKDIPKKPTFAAFASVESLYRQLKINL